jgi:hypothetical protein
MPNRRLVLSREALVTLHPDDLSSVAGAISTPHPTCVVTSVQYSQCPTCGIACTYACPTRECPTDYC